MTSKPPTTDLIRFRFNPLQRLRRSRPFKALRGYFNRLQPFLTDSVGGHQSHERRLLVIYDLTTQPFSIGDILAIQEASLVLRETYGVHDVDFAVVYDPHYGACPDPAFAGITEENILYHLASVLPAAQVNPYLGSLFVFSSHQQLRRFIVDSGDMYHVWPGASDYVRGHYLYYDVINDLLYEYYQRRHTLPSLSCRGIVVEWAKRFYNEHVYPDVPVTVQLRQNKRIDPSRNSRMECWLELFRWCHGSYPVKFIVVGAIAELDDRFRSCPNVILAKDWHTTLEQDLGLIQTSAIHMGASSGPGTMAWFNSKPYLMVNTSLIPGRYRGLMQEGCFVRYFYAGPLQRQTIGAETTELLCGEFARMWESIDRESFPRDADATESPTTTCWLR